MLNEKEKLAGQLRKEVKIFREKRDLWKERNADKRKQLQIALTKINDMEESRDKWKTDAKESKTLLKNAQQELEEVKALLKIKEQEIDVFKKKLKF